MTFSPAANIVSNHSGFSAPLANRAAAEEPMKNSAYLAQVASLAGLRHFENQGPWGRKAGAVMGMRDGYIECIGLIRAGNSSKVVIILRFRKIEQPEMLKTGLVQNLSPDEKKHGKLAAVGKDFARWEWTYSFSKPKPEDVAHLADHLREAIKPLAAGLDAKCEDCQTTTDLILQNGLPVYRCLGCQERLRHELDKATMDYEALEPKYVNGLVLGVGAAIVGGLAWGLIAYGINYIFLYGAIGIGYFVAWAMIKGTGKVTLLGQVLIPILTVASVLFGDVIFFTLAVMREKHLAFSGELLRAIVTHLYEIETGANGVISLIFALIGAGVGLYSIARRPKFKAAFEPLGAPAT
jgi:hypothetical protein